jgi:hypothetical protein
MGRERWQLFKQEVRLRYRQHSRCLQHVSARVPASRSRLPQVILRVVSRLICSWKWGMGNGYAFDPEDDLEVSLLPMNTLVPYGKLKGSVMM